MVRRYPGGGLPEVMAKSRCELTVRGPVSQSLLAVIRTRFEHVSMPDAGGPVLVIEDLDQSAVRALLTLLWDAGHEVLSMKSLE